MPIYKGSYPCKKCGAFPWCYKIEDAPNTITCTTDETHNATGHLDIGGGRICINLECPACHSKYSTECQK